MATNERDTTYGFLSILIMTVAATVIVGIVFGYKNCEHDSDRILDCINQTHDICQCNNAFSAAHNHTDCPAASR
jgi:hypothetical protein